MFRRSVLTQFIQAIEKPTVSVAKRKAAASRAGTAPDDSDVADRDPCKALTGRRERSGTSAASPPLFRGADMGGAGQLSERPERQSWRLDGE